MRKYSNFITLKGKDILAERDGIEPSGEWLLSPTIKYVSFV